MGTGRYDGRIRGSNERGGNMRGGNDRGRKEEEKGA